MKPLILLVCCSLGVAAQPLKRPRILGIAHVAFGVTSLDKARDFYKGLLGFEEPFGVTNPNGTTRLIFVKINDRQFLELFPDIKPRADRLLHIAFETDDAKAMRNYLASRGVNVPPEVRKGRTGNWNFIIDDPDGHAVEITQYAPGSDAMRVKGKRLGAKRISTRLMHTGILCGNVERAMRFYRDLLGFEETWRGSSSGKELSWINLKVPDGEDYLELMLYRDLPATNARGSHHHVCLEVPDVAKAVAVLEANPYRKTHSRPVEQRVGTNRKRQVNLFDPDGTRVELMEPKTVDSRPVPPSKAPPPRG
jgi:lactoylglutathione lyase